MLMNTTFLGDSFSIKWQSRVLSQSFLFFNSFLAKRTKAVRGRWEACMAGGWKKRGKSNRPKAPPDGHRSDSTGIVYQFPSQRSSDSGFVTLRLSRPPGLRNTKIFSQTLQMSQGHAPPLRWDDFWLSKAFG